MFSARSRLGQGLATHWAARSLALAGARAVLARMLHMKEGPRLDVEVSAITGERLDLAGFRQQMLHRHVIPGRPHLESRSMIDLLYAPPPCSSNTTRPVTDGLLTDSLMAMCPGASV